MSHAILKLASRKSLTDNALAAFLQEHQFPIVEGTSATFCYLGAADEVNVRHFAYGLPSFRPAKRLLGSDLWYCVMDIPQGSRIEYKLEVIRNGDAQWILDPLNPRVARDPFGANSVCQGPGYAEPDWVAPDPEARPGTISNVPFPSEALGGVRSVNLYLPARFRKRRRYPLLVAHDGDDYVRFSNLKQVLDNLIHRQEIPPMIVALTNPQRRLQEYAADRAHSTFIVEELLPWLEKEFPLLEGPAARGLMGASFGAVASLAIGLHYPGVFGNLLLQSGSFAFSDFGPHARTKEFDPVVKFINAFRERPKKPAERAFVTCGIFESLVYENRSMVPVFQQTGMSVRYVEARDGHNWENWRDRLREGLSWLFPGPLWLVYE